MIELVNDYIKVMNNAEKISYSRYKEKNKYRLMWFEILNRIDRYDNKIVLIFNIIKNNTSFEILNWLVWYLRKYEPDLVKKILLYNSKTDPLSELLYYNWDKDQLDNETNRSDETKQKIEKYNKWKDENKIEYGNILKELNKIISTLEIKLSKK